jgi:hypothetical protein
MMLFRGQPFVFTDNPFPSLMFLIDCFGFYLLFSIIPESMLFPQNLRGPIYFLSKLFCSDYSAQFQLSLSNLIENIDQLHFDQFHPFHNFILVSIVSSGELTIPNEDSLLQLLIEMISADPNRKILLKVIHFPFI